MLAISFGEALWLIIVSFLFIAYLVALFSVMIDVFRDPDLGGVAKAIWVVALIIFPLITMVVYLIARGSGMADRELRGRAEAKQSFDSYVRDVAGSGIATELEKASALHESGRISDEEYAGLKAKILG